MLDAEMILSKSAKTHYSEAEAAAALGITVEQFRTLVRNHIMDGNEDPANIPRTTFHPSDLLVLKLLCGLPTAPTTQG